MRALAEGLSDTMTWLGELVGLCSVLDTVLALCGSMCGAYLTFFIAYEFGEDYPVVHWPPCSQYRFNSRIHLI